jgi:hypothetical protein
MGSANFVPSHETPDIGNAVILECVARMAYFTLGINSKAETIGGPLHDKHFRRKHGKDACCGQPKERK